MPCISLVATNTVRGGGLGESIDGGYYGVKCPSEGHAVRYTVSYCTLSMEVGMEFILWVLTEGHSVPHISLSMCPGETFPTDFHLMWG
jgi:hypothetical protein